MTTSVQRPLPCNKPSEQYHNGHLFKTIRHRSIANKSNKERPKLLHSTSRNGQLINDGPTDGVKTLIFFISKGLKRSPNVVVGLCSFCFRFIQYVLFVLHIYILQ